MKELSCGAGLVSLLSLLQELTGNYIKDSDFFGPRFRMQNKWHAYPPE